MWDRRSRRPCASSASGCRSATRASCCAGTRADTHSESPNRRGRASSDPLASSHFVPRRSLWNPAKAPSAERSFIRTITGSTEQSELNVRVRHGEDQDRIVHGDDTDFECFAGPVQVGQNYPSAHNYLSCMRTETLPNRPSGLLLQGPKISSPVRDAQSAVRTGSLNDETIVDFGLV